MEITLSKRDKDEIVQNLRLALRKDIKDMLKDILPPEFVSTAEAAAILRITPGRLRQIVCQDPNRYPHIKTGDNKQAKLLFDRNALTK